MIRDGGDDADEKAGQSRVESALSRLCLDFVSALREKRGWKGGGKVADWPLTVGEEFAKVPLNSPGWLAGNLRKERGRRMALFVFGLEVGVQDAVHEIGLGQFLIGEVGGDVDVVADVVQLLVLVDAFAVVLLDVEDVGHEVVVAKPVSTPQHN